MLHSINKNKYIVYIFFFIILSTFNNLNLNKINTFNITDIEITELNHINNNILLERKLTEDLNYLKNQNIFFINQNQLKTILSKNEWLSNFSIKKEYPAKLVINYEKTKPIANIIIDNENFLIGSNYKLIKSDFKNPDLPNIFGKPKLKEFKRIIDLINISKIKINNISDFYYFKSNRWNLKLKNDILIKLPEEKVVNSLNLAWKILKSEKILLKNSINLSVKNQIIVN